MAQRNSLPFNWLAASHRSRAGACQSRRGTLLASFLLAATSSALAQVDGPVWSKRYAPATAPPPAEAQATTLPPGTSPWAQPLDPNARPVVIAPPGASPAYPGSGTYPVQRAAPANPDPGWYAAQGQLATALSQLRAAIHAQPDNVALRLQEARYLGWLNRHHTAAAKYGEILRSQPDNFEAQVGLGNTFLWRGNWREAMEQFSRAAGRAPAGDLSAHLGHLRALQAQGRASAAHQYARQLDESTGRQNPELGLFLAEQFATLNLDGEAGQHASRPSTDPDLQRRQQFFHTKRGIANTGGRAEDEFARRFANSAGSDYNSLVSGGEALILAGRHKEAATHLARALQIAPERDDAHLHLGRIAKLQGRHRDALLHHQAAVQANPESLQGWLGIAEAARFNAEYDRAWQALDSASAVAPRSALVYREQLRLATLRHDEPRFNRALQEYRHYQSGDAHAELLAAQWASQHGRPVNVAALQQILDPMAPELNAAAATLISRHSGASLDEIAARMPVPAAPELQAAARGSLERQVRHSHPDFVSVTTGYEFSSVKDTTGTGVRFTEWHEGYLAAYWRQKLGSTWSFEYRAYERFADDAHQLLFGWDTPVSTRWILGLNGGGAISGGFIPRWRVGAQATYLHSERLTGELRFNHLRFADEPVFQFVPGVTWKWSPRFSSTARLYVTHSSPKGLPENLGVAGYVDFAWLFAPNSHAKIHYSLGDENGNSLIKGLIGENEFQSTGLELRLGLNDTWAIVPSYRFERHQLFDLHAIGLSLNARF